MTPVDQALLTACFARSPSRIDEAIAQGAEVSLRHLEIAADLRDPESVGCLRRLWSAWPAEVPRDEARQRLLQKWSTNIAMNPDNWNYRSRDHAKQIAEVLFAGVELSEGLVKTCARFPDSLLLECAINGAGRDGLLLAEQRAIIEQVTVTQGWVPFVVKFCADAPDTVVADMLHRSMNSPAATAALLERSRFRQALSRHPEFFLKCAMALGHANSVDRMFACLMADGLPKEDVKVLGVAIIRSIWNGEVFGSDDKAIQAQAQMIGRIGRLCACTLHGESFEGQRHARLAPLMQAVAALGAEVPDLVLFTTAYELRKRICQEAAHSGFEAETESELVFSTRDDGNVGEGIAGSNDRRRARTLAERIEGVVNETVIVDEIDEWVMIQVPEDAIMRAAHATLDGPMKATVKGKVSCSM